MTRIALAQLEVVPGDVPRNLRRAGAAVAEATRRGAHLVVFPELFVSGTAVGGAADATVDPSDPRVGNTLREAGPSTSVVLTMQERGPDGARYNTAAHYHGGVLGHIHRKVALVSYPPFNEHVHFDQGQQLRTFQTADGVKAAILICNDAWQPNIASRAVGEGAELLIIPINSARSSFTKQMDTQARWELITTFYAELRQTHVVMVNRVGREGAFHFFGASRIVDGVTGRVTEAAPGREQLLIADLDFGALRERRRAVPLLGNTRPDLTAAGGRTRPVPPRPGATLRPARRELLG